MSYCLSPAKWRSLTKAQRQAALNDYASLEGYSGSDEHWEDLYDDHEYRMQKFEEIRKKRQK